MDYHNAPTFWQALQDMPGQGARALRFTILTAARSGETRGATWDEIHLDQKDGPCWIIPGERMKAGEPHTVPLCTGAVAILNEIPPGRRKGLIFPGISNKTGEPVSLSDMTLAAVLKRMKLKQYTVHGFRSTFRTWADEQTSYSREVKEAALAHAFGDETERAYNRAKHIENRTGLMQLWCDYLTNSGRQ
jgi:integrase